jgi:hypothetical protein
VSSMGLSSRPGDLVVHVLRAVVGVEAADREGEAF